MLRLEDAAALEKSFSFLEKDGSPEFPPICPEEIMVKEKMLALEKDMEQELTGLFQREAEICRDEVIDFLGGL